MSADLGPRVSIVVVNWNTRDLLLECLRSIKEGAAGVTHETIVVDNASSDGSVEAVRANFPEVRLIVNDSNVGFAAANNTALREARGEMALLLNPDTVVPAGAVNLLRDFMLEHADVGMVGPLLVGGDGAPQISSFGLFPSPLEAAAHALRVWRVAPRSRLARRFVLAPEGSETWVYTNHLLGACILMRMEVYEQTGGFDEGFPLFLEETDLCYRAQSAGWRIAYTTDVRITHYGEQSMQGILHKSGGLYIRSYNRFCRKHGMGPFRRLAANLLLIAGVLVDSLMGLVKARSPRRAAQCAKALWYGYCSTPRLPS